MQLDGWSHQAVVGQELRLPHCQKRRSPEQMGDFIQFRDLVQLAIVYAKNFHPPSFFFTRTIGLAHGLAEGTGTITFCDSISAINLSTSSHKAKGIRLAGCRIGG